MTSITESQIALTRRRVNFMPVPSCDRFVLSGMISISVYRTRPAHAANGVTTPVHGGPGGSSSRVSPRAEIRGPARARLQVVDREDGPADRFDLARDVLLRAQVPMVGERLGWIPERIRHELVAARVRRECRGKRGGQLDAVQHGP